MRDDDELYEIEVVDGELVEQPATAVEQAGAARLPSWVSPPALQVAAATATGFVAGAATLALLRRRGQSRLEPAARTREPTPVGRERTYIVHVRPLRPYVE